MAKSKIDPIPIVSHLQDLDERLCIVYLCPKCKGSLEMLGNLAQNCPHCSFALDCGELPMRVSPAFRDKYEAILYAEEKKSSAKSKSEAPLKEERLRLMLDEYISTHTN